MALALPPKPAKVLGYTKEGTPIDYTPIETPDPPQVAVASTPIDYTPIEMPRTIQYATPPLMPLPPKVPVAFTPIVTSASIPITTMAMPQPAGYSTLLTSYPIEILPTKPYSEMEKEPAAAGKSEEKSGKAAKVVKKTKRGCC
mmetsp:Transcript_80569/g.126907  ORF Transcript_80569/g.126907 Transcript_80569/m.126907 type:complete len:143 (-) Transcript_80569:331-759(-)